MNIFPVILQNFRFILVKWSLLIFVLFIVNCEVPIDDVIANNSDSDLDSQKIKKVVVKELKTQWINEDGISNEDINTFLTTVKNASIDGLEPEDYNYSNIIHEFFKLKRLHHKDTLERYELVKKLNFMLDQAFITYAKHQINGRLQNEVDNPFNYHQITERELRDSIRKVLAHGDMKQMLDGFICPMPIYKQFKALLMTLILKKRASQGNGILKLKGQNVASRMTLLDTQILIVRINMERCRWYGRQFNDTQVIVNVPSCMLHLNVRNLNLLKMKVIVGRKANQTPMIKSQIENIIIHPYWYIPPGIVSREILPAIRKNKSYLSNNHIRILRDGVSSRFRQEPGPWNALGEIKFNFPNNHYIYLHDTPYKELFQKETRLFSSGCIRIEKPRELAAILLSIDSSEVVNILNPGVKIKESWIPFKKKCDVWVTYWTVEFDHLGFPIFLKDVYDKDKRLMHLMKASSIEQGFSMAY